MHPVDRNIQGLGLALPACSRPAGNYLPATRHGGLLFVSGQFPIRDGKVVYQGRVGEALSPSDGYLAAQLAALNALAHIRRETDGWRCLGQLIKLEGHISSADGWYGQPTVLDGASDLFKEVLEDRAGHARTVFAYPQLPLNATVELVVTVALAQAQGGASGFRP